MKTKEVMRRARDRTVLPEHVNAGVAHPHNTRANCDVCDAEPGNRMVMAYGIETWVCDTCSGRAAP